MTFTISCLLLVTSFLLLSCSLPNLEDADCTQSRDSVREFYSYHFGHNLGFAAEDINARREYLTPNFFSSLSETPRDVPPGVDPFTRMDDPPKAFRVGECHVLEPGTRTSFEVLLFWKDDVKSEQRPINVEVIQSGEKWLIDRVSK
ncbi:MAG: hypothetical protein ABI646_02070 [Acidobacteriota bacterium]